VAESQLTIFSVFHRGEDSLCNEIGRNKGLKSSEPKNSKHTPAGRKKKSLSKNRGEGKKVATANAGKKGLTLARRNRQAREAIVQEN